MSKQNTLYDNDSICSKIITQFKQMCDNTLPIDNSNTIFFDYYYSSGKRYKFPIEVDRLLPNGKADRENFRKYSIPTLKTLGYDIEEYPQHWAEKDEENNYENSQNFHRALISSEYTGLKILISYKKPDPMNQEIANKMFENNLEFTNDIKRIQEVIKLNFNIVITDSQAEKIWRTFSDIVYCAGWLSIGDYDIINAFKWYAINYLEENDFEEYYIWKKELNTYFNE